MITEAIQQPTPTLTNSSDQAVGRLHKTMVLLAQKGPEPGLLHYVLVALTILSGVMILTAPELGAVAVFWISGALYLLVFVVVLESLLVLRHVASVLAQRWLARRGGEQ